MLLFAKNIAVTEGSSPANLLLCRSTTTGSPNVVPLKVDTQSCPFGQPVKTLPENMNAPRPLLHAVPVVAMFDAGPVIGVAARSTRRFVTASTAVVGEFAPQVPTDPVAATPDPSWRTSVGKAPVFAVGTEVPPASGKNASL